MILRLDRVSKDFRQGDQTIHVIQDLTLNVQEGETLAILGPSGSGKSTLLSLIAGLDKPTRGDIIINNQKINDFDEESLTEFRAKNLGIVFQQYYLFSHLTALENVALPLELLNRKDAEAEAKRVLELVGLGHRLDHFPSQMSGGENQRVAIARAFIVKPKLLLADEPSGSLDTKTGDHVMDLLFQLAKTEKTTMILVTHNEELANRCNNQFRFN